MHDSILVDVCKLAILASFCNVQVTIFASWDRQDSTFAFEMSELISFATLCDVQISHLLLLEVCKLADFISPFVIVKKKGRI